MSTRGAVGFIKNGFEKVGYNHFDSYPTGLGSGVIIFLKKNNIEKLNKIFDEIILEGDDECFTEDNEFNMKFNDSSIFLRDSLFCEYAYLINLDTNMLEYYQGFNKNPNEKGRYAKYTVDDEKKYYGVKLIQEIPLQDIIVGKYTTDDKKGFILKRGE